MGPESRRFSLAQPDWRGGWSHGAPRHTRPRPQPALTPPHTLSLTLHSFAALALLATTALGAEKFEISEDPLDLSNEFPHDYRNWASMLSNVLLKSEGSEDGAAKALERVMLATHGHLSKVANGEEIFPRFHLQDPMLTLGKGGLVPGAPAVTANQVRERGGWLMCVCLSRRALFFFFSNPTPTPPTQQFASSATFFNYAPCVLSESTTGASASLTGLNIAPNLIQLGALGAGAFAQGVNIAPQIIYVTPTAVNIQPQGLNVQPGLIYVGPIGANVQPQGGNIQPALINVAPAGVNVQPQGSVVAPVKKAIGPVHVLYNPQKGPVYAPVAHDLTAPAAGAVVGAADAGRR